MSTHASWVLNRIDIYHKAEQMIIIFRKYINKIDV